MKKTISIALVLVLLFVAIPFAYADDPTTPAEDPVISEIIAAGSLTFSGTTANCSGSVTDNGKWISATRTLSHNGSTVRSWSGSGRSNVTLNGSCTVVSGWSYTLVISGTVDGVAFSTTPYTATCP